MTADIEAQSTPKWLVEPEIRPHGEVFKLANVPVYQGSRGDAWVLACREGDEFWVTDFATVPRVAVWLIPQFGKFTLAAIVHDWFCAIGILAGVISPRDADGVFRQALRIAGVSFLSRWLAWTGVRWGAAFNPIRRHGWWRDFPKMIPFTLLALPIMLPAVVGIVFGLALFGFAQLAISMCLRNEKTTTGVDVTT